MKTYIFSHKTNKNQVKVIASSLDIATDWMKDNIEKPQDYRFRGTTPVIVQTTIGGC